MEYPKLEFAAGGQRLDRTRIILGALQWGVGVEVADDADGNVWRLLHLMDGSRTRSEIVDTICRERPQVDRGSVQDAIDALIATGFVEDAGIPPPPELTADELERYERSRHFFAWIDRTPRPSPWEIQCRLKAARVCVLGLGGAGTTVAASLAASGVGALTCVDFDEISLSNLNRALLYSEADIGRAKVDVALSRLRQLNRHVDVQGRELKITASEDLDEFMDSHDLVVLCADEPAPDIGLWTNESALRTGSPWQLCLYAGPMVVTGIFVPGETACWRCLPGSDGGLPNVAEFEVLNDARVNAVIGPSAGLTGHAGALLAVYFLAGLPVQAVGRVYHHSLTQLDHAYFVGPLDTPCPACGRLGGEPARAPAASCADLEDA